MTMSESINEKEYFIRVLRDYVHGSVSAEPEEPFNWFQLYKYAKKHDLQGIVYTQCRNMKSISHPVLKLLSKGFMSDVYLSVNDDYAVSQIEKLFSEEGIAYMPFKGSLIRDYYPNPELRTMGDRDILIHKSDCNKADEIMIRLEYDRMIDNHAVWTYTKPHLMFEIHNEMFYETLTSDFDYRAYFSKSWDSAVKENSSMKYIPDHRIHFLYIIAHTAKHIVNHGIGFRAFLDMVFYCKAYPEQSFQNDWNWIKRELIRMKLYDFCLVCFVLCSKWFETDMPFIKEADKDIDFESFENKIFNDGLFGLKNRENEAAHTAKELRKSRHPFIITALMITARQLFPPYRDLQLIPWYSWVDGKPWLLPAAWVYRWIYCLIHKRTESRDLLLEPYTKQNQIRMRDEYLDKWRL